MGGLNSPRIYHSSWNMKNRKERAEREVTDPVTHLPVTIHDFTDEALKEVSYNTPRRPNKDTKSEDELRAEAERGQHDHDRHQGQPQGFDRIGCAQGWVQCR